MNQQTGVRKPRFFYGYLVVALAFIIQAMLGGTLATFSVFFKPLATEFEWTRAVTSGAFSLYMVLHGFLYIFTGKLNDRVGTRIVMTGCGLLMGVGYILMSQISTLWHLYLFYGVIIAIGMSGGFVPIMSTVTRWFVSHKRRGLMIGISLAGGGFGTMIMPPLANWLISSYGWQMSY
ncbi:MAG: MFS transporter, partial [Dehalococcoidales bacterium]